MIILRDLKPTKIYRKLNNNNAGLKMYANNIDHEKYVS